MSGIGDSAPRKYVQQEFVRRTIGMCGRRYGGGSAGTDSICGIDNLRFWHHTKRPWIRLVSNAVPIPELDTLPEWKEATEVFNGNPENSTRFRHILWGGTGVYDEAEKRVNLGHSFEHNYVNPFQVGTDDEEKNPNLKRNYKPMPGITDLNVTYKGDLGALKKATIAFNVYTLQDLERLEKLYMYPGIRLLCEWGWSINTADEAADRGHRDVNLIQLDDTILADPNKVHSLISNNRYLSGGCYDGMFGTVVNFNYSVQEDLSFSCKVDITDFGDSIFTIATNTPFKAGSSDFENKDGLTLFSALEDIHKKFSKSGVGKNNQISEESIDLKQVGVFKAKIFKIKTGTTSKTTSDKNKTERKQQLYIRFGDIVDVLLNKMYGLTSESTRAAADSDGSSSSAIALFSIGGTEADRSAGLSNGTIESKINEEDEDKAQEIPVRPVSIISNHSHLISTDPDVCLLPNQIGEDPYTTVSEANSKYNTSKYVPTGLKGEGCDFNVPKSVADLFYNDYQRESVKGAGFLANIFINFDILLAYAETARDVQDFLQSITTDVNKACGSIWSFQWKMLDEYQGYMTCVDSNFSWSGKVECLELAVDSQSSLVKALSMQSQISNQLKNSLYIAAQGPFTGTDVKLGEMHNKNIIPLDVEFAIDGVSGIQYGTSFSIDYMPSRYRDQAYLFAKQVQHSINLETWTTTVTAGFRWAPLEGSLRKIKLGKIPPSPQNDQNLIVSTTDSILDVITEDNAVQNDGQEAEKVYGNNKLYPNSVFRSLESKDLIMGGSGDNPESGMPINEVQEKQEAKEDQETNLSERMAKLYNIGSNDGDVSESQSILQDLLFKAPEEGGAAPPKAEKKQFKKKTQKKQTVIKPDPFEFTKVLQNDFFQSVITIPTDRTFYNSDIVPPEFKPTKKQGGGTDRYNSVLRQG